MKKITYITLFFATLFIFNFKITANIIENDDFNEEKDAENIWIEPENIEHEISSTTNFQARLKNELQALEKEDKKIDKINELSDKTEDEVKVTNSGILKNSNLNTNIEEPANESLFLELDPKNQTRVRRIRSR